MCLRKECTIASILEAERNANLVIEQEKQKIVSDIQNCDLKNVKSLAPNIVVVKLSQLQNNVWSPDYYIMEKQALYVRQFMSGAKTVTMLMERLKTMIDDGYVKIGTSRYRLNEKTIEIIRNHYIE